MNINRLQAIHIIYRGGNRHYSQILIAPVAPTVWKWSIKNVALGNFCFARTLVQTWPSGPDQYKNSCCFADLEIHWGIIWETDLKSNYVESSICWFSLRSIAERELSGSLSGFCHVYLLPGVLWHVVIFLLVLSFSL